MADLDLNYHEANAEECGECGVPCHVEAADVLAMVAAVRAAIDVRNDPDGSLAVWDALDEALAPFGDDR